MMGNCRLFVSHTQMFIGNVILLLDIEEFIGYKILVVNYDSDLLPELTKPEPRRRKPGAGGRERRPGNNRRRSGKRSARSS